MDLAFDSTLKISLSTEYYLLFFVLLTATLTEALLTAELPVDVT